MSYTEMTSPPSYNCSNETQLIIKNNPLTGNVNTMIEKYSSTNTKEFVPDLMTKAKELRKNIASLVADTIVEKLTEFTNDECKKFNIDKLFGKSGFKYEEYQTSASLIFLLGECETEWPFIKRCNNRLNGNLVLESMCYPIINSFGNKNITEDQVVNTLTNNKYMEIIQNDPRLKGFIINFTDDYTTIYPYTIQTKNKQWMSIKTRYISVSWEMFPENIGFFDNLFFGKSELYKTINMKTTSYMYNVYLNSKKRKEITEKMFETIKNLKNTFQISLNTHEYMTFEQFLLNDTYFNGLKLNLCCKKYPNHFILDAEIIE